MTMRARGLVVLLAGTLGCGACGAPTSADAGRADSGRDGGRDGGPPLVLPSVRRFTVPPCEGWPPQEAVPVPEPRPWSVVWSAPVPLASDPVWRERTDFVAPSGQGGSLSALTRDRFYVPIADVGGVTAFSMADGALLWGRELPGGRGDWDDPTDDEGILGPLVATPDGGVLVHSTLDKLYAYDRDGGAAFVVDGGVARPDPSLHSLGPRVALGPGGLIFWSPAGRSSVLAVNRCGQTVWRAEWPAGLTYQDRFPYVDAAGSLLVVATLTAVYRLAPDGSSVDVAFDNATAGLQHISVDAVLNDGSLHIWNIFRGDFIDRAMGTRTGEILGEIRYPQENTVRVTPLDPFGQLAWRTWLEGETRINRGYWIRPGVEIAFDFPAGIPVFLSSRRGVANLSGGLVLVVPTMGAVDGVVLLSPDGSVERQLPDEPVGGEARLLPDGRLVTSIREGFGLIQTDVSPAPGWSHWWANAWNSSSLAVCPGCVE